MRTGLVWRRHIGMETVDLHIDLLRAVSRLGEMDRFVVLRRFWGQMTLAEIAADLGLSIGRVAQLEARAIWRLQKIMKAPRFTGGKHQRSQPLASVEPIWRFPLVIGASEFIEIKEGVVANG